MPHRRAVLHDVCHILVLGVVLLVDLVKLLDGHFLRVVRTVVLVDSIVVLTVVVRHFVLLLSKFEGALTSAFRALKAAGTSQRIPWPS